MLHRPANKRKGISLLEVLTAIFIMGIGMLALLTLFPLGALSMARAIRDDRAAHIAANAAAVAAAFDLRNDEEIVKAFDDATHKVGNDSLPSNPVYVDPHYVRLNARPLGEYPANSGSTAIGIKRVAPLWVYRNGNTYRDSAGTPTIANVAYWFTFQDEIEFDTLGGAKGWENGTPQNPATINRPGTYSHAYFLRRPRQGTREMVDLTVVVYSQRNTDTIEGEDTYYNEPPNNQNWSMGDTGDTVITVDYTNFTKPDFRKGSWILDTTYRGAADKKTINGHFYRVENALEQSGNTFQLELDRPLRAPMNTIVLMKKVIAVVERGTAWRP